MLGRYLDIFPSNVECPRRPSTLYSKILYSALPYFIDKPIVSIYLYTYVI